MLRKFWMSAVVVAITAMASAAYATTSKAPSSGGMSHGVSGLRSFNFGGSHGLSSGFSSHGFSGHGFGSSHGGSSHASHEKGDEKGGKEGKDGKDGKDGKAGKDKGHDKGKEAHGKGFHGGRVLAGFAGAFRNSLYWLYWPFAYYATPDQLALSCAEDAKDIAGLPADQFGQAVQPTGQAAGALDDLELAETKAVQGIKMACPGDMPLTAPGRMAAMQRRIEAMIAAVELMNPPLEKFYGLLDDEQKARVNTISNEAFHRMEAEYASDLDGCGPSMLSGTELPAADIDRAVHLTDPQRKSLLALQNTDTQAAADVLKVTCGVDKPITPTGRLTADHKRLDVMLGAAKAVGAAINDFYATLSDEQKAKLEAIGPIVVAEEVSLPEPEPEPVGHRYYNSGPPPIRNIIRHLLPF
jgi:LTXXQ motif family protein